MLYVTRRNHIGEAKATARMEKTGYYSEYGDREVIRTSNVPDLLLTNRVYKLDLQLFKINNYLKHENLVFVDAEGNMYNLVIDFVLCFDEQFDALRKCVNDTGYIDYSVVQEVLEVAMVTPELIPYEPAVDVLSEPKLSKQYASNVYMRFMNPLLTSYILRKEAAYFKVHFCDDSILTMLTQTLSDRLYLMKLSTGKISDIAIRYYRSNNYKAKKMLTRVYGIELFGYSEDKNPNALFDQQFCRHSTYSPVKKISDTLCVCDRCGKTISRTAPTEEEEVKTAINTLYNLNDWARIQRNLLSPLDLKESQLYNNRLKKLEKVANQYAEMVKGAKRL